ncbi:uncharacterized protein [Penaeus vannamei]|uniref:uncharacterized protein isoform X5 n=1 Tax=Penaeus vannamei TaxID=6689 RepID=UPI00387F48ED
MGSPRRSSPPWPTWLLVWFAAPLALAAVASLDIEVTVPPLIGPDLPKEEVLFTVNHDPEQEPEPLTLPCRADGLPAPSYSWLKDGSPYDWHDDGDDDGDDDNGAGERVEMLQGEGTLVFHDPQPEDEGVYQCIAENSVGVAHSDLITVRRAVMGSFPKAEHRIVTAAEWQPLKLPCTPPEGYPEPTLHWVLQNSDGGLRSLDSERITVDEEGTLWFSYVTREDASGDALYACAASSATSGQKMYLVKDEDGFLEVLEDPPEDDSVTVISLPTEYRMGNWVYLNVSYPEDEESTHPEASIAPVKQYLSPRQITVLEGEDVKLHCLYGGYPVPDIRWWRESRADVEDDQLEHFGKILVLEDVDHEDTGSYYCQASNEAGESEAHQFTVYVEAAPEFIVEPEVVNLPEGETATLSCEAKGDPEPIITWTKNGQPMDTHETTLMFDRLSFADKTVIACNASNEHGYVYKSVYLNVLSLPPEWMTEPKDVYVLEGGSAELECEAFGSPDPEITWARRDGDEKTVIHDEDPRYDVNDHQLLINTVDDTTDGTYVCTATNKFASIESEAKVAMRSMTRAEVSIKDERVEAGDHVTLDCRVAIDPLLKSSVTWLKDNVEIDLKDDNFHLGQRAADEKDDDDDDDDDKHKIENWVLEIEEVHGHDSGVYTCRVHTDLDDVTDDLILTVEDVPNPPSLTNVECNPRSAYLGWASTGDNNAKLQGFVIQYRTRLHPEWKDAKNQIPAADTSFTSRFQTTAIVNMSPGLNYTYRVLAFNRVGMSEPSEDTAECSAPGLPPDFHPENVTVSGPAPGVLHVSWEEMEPEDHNGPDFQYKVSWRALDDDNDDDDADEDDGNATVAEEDGDEDGWQTKMIEDWEESELELENLPPYQEYEVKVEARNSYGEALEEADVITGFSGQDEPEVAPAKVRVADADATDVVLTWKPVDEDSLNGPLLGYKVEYWEESDDSDPEEILTTGPVARAELTGLRPFTNYHARISVANTEYTGPSSDTVEFTTAEGDAGAVSDLEVRAMGADSLVVKWDAPDDPQGVILGYEVRYQKVDEDGEEEWEHYEGHIPASTRMVKLADLEEEVSYEVSVAAVNGAGEGEWTSSTVDLEAPEPQVPAVPVFSWSFQKEVEEDHTDRDGDGDVDEEDIRNKNMIIGDTDGDGDVDEDDVLDTDNDGDIDEEDIAVADIDNDGDVDEDDVEAADRDGDGDVDIADIGDEDGDGDFDGDDVIAADEDGDGDIDAADEDEENVLLEDKNADGVIDEDDVGDINNDGIIDEEDLDEADIDNDGDVDEDDLKIADKDGDGDVDAADVLDLDGDGRVDGDDLEVTDRDGDGDIDARDYKLKSIFLSDVDGDGDVDSDDVIDVDDDGDIDEDDKAIADIDNDGDVDEDDVKAADRDGDGDVDIADIGDEDDDGDIDGQDVILADKDGDGDIDASDDDEEDSLLEDRNGDGTIDRDDVGDLDGDGDVDLEDFQAADIDDDGDVDADDVKAADRDGDGDVDAADVLDLDGDGEIDGDDLELEDRDGDGDIDIKDVKYQHTLLADTDGDGDIDEDDVLDIDGDGDIDETDIKAADIDDDGDVDEDDLKHSDRDGDNDVDASDVQDLDGDGFIDEDDLDVKDKDGDGDIDRDDFRLRKVILADTDNDGDIDEDDVLDTDNDGDVDQEDIDVADIDNDGDVDKYDIAAADRDHDGDVDVADIGDEDGDGDVDGDDVIKADKDGDGDIDNEDDDGEHVLLSDIDGDGDIDVTDIDNDGDVDEDDRKAADVDNDGDVDKDDVAAADRDGDGDVDAADILDVDGDGDVDAKDLMAADKDGDGDIDQADVENMDVFLKDTDGDGDVDEDDVLDTDHDGDVDEEDIAVADIDNDGDVDMDDVIAADQDGDGDVDFKDIGDEDGDGNIDGDDLEAADRDGDGDVDAADDGRGVDVVINWKPDFDKHPGVDFYVESRIQGTSEWQSSPVERRHLYQTLSGLDPRRNYEVRVVARDGDYETPSGITVIQASEDSGKSPSSEELSHPEQDGTYTALMECDDEDTSAAASVQCRVVVSKVEVDVIGSSSGGQNLSDGEAVERTGWGPAAMPGENNLSSRSNGKYTVSSEETEAPSTLGLDAEYDYIYSPEDHYPDTIDGINILYEVYQDHTLPPESPGSKESIPEVASVDGERRGEAREGTAVLATFRSPAEAISTEGEGDGKDSAVEVTVGETDYAEGDVGEEDYVVIIADEEEYPDEDKDYGDFDDESSGGVDESGRGEGDRDYYDGGGRGNEVYSGAGRSKDYPLGGSDDEYHVPSRGREDISEQYPVTETDDEDYYGRGSGDKEHPVTGTDDENYPVAGEYEEKYPVIDETDEDHPEIGTDNEDYPIAGEYDEEYPVTDTDLEEYPVAGRDDEDYPVMGTYDESYSGRGSGDEEQPTTGRTGGRYPVTDTDDEDYYVAGAGEEKYPLTGTVDEEYSVPEADGEAYPVTGTDGDEYPVTGTGDEDYPVTGTEDKDYPVSGTEDNDYPVSGTEDEDYPVSGTEDEDYPVSGTEDEDYPVTGTEDKDYPVTGSDDEDYPVTGSDDEDYPVTGSDDEDYPVTGTEEEDYPVTGSDDEDYPVTGSDDEDYPVTGTEEEDYPVTGSDDEDYPVTGTVEEEHPVTGDEDARTDHESLKRAGAAAQPGRPAVVPAYEEMSEDGNFYRPDMGQEEPTVGAVVEDNPILWTWFVIAVMASVTMICVVFFSMWVYSHRMARVAELRASLYEGYEPAQPEPTKKDADVEAAKPEEVVEDEMTANFQRKGENRKSWYHVQLAAMMKRQETVQSVDSFASHDDDFAEYGDESMGRFTDDGSLIHQRV